jgi:predicted dehydrogenase
MFIDKPITVSETDAINFMRELKANGVKACGGSSCVHAEYVKELKAMIASGEHGKVLGGDLRAPISMDNAYGGFFFYSQHLVQVMCELFGFYPKSVKAFTNDKKYSFVVRYDEYDVWASFVEGNYVYSASVSLEKRYVGDTYNLDNCYEAEFMEFYHLLTGSEQTTGYREIIAPVYILNAMYRALQSGAEEAVNPAGEV